MSKSKSAVAMTLAFLTLSACAALRTENALPYKHPVALDKGRPTCTECHTEDKKIVAFKRFNHTVLWLEDHRLAAYQREKVCSGCHDQSFCLDCHETNRVELRPDIKRQTDTYRRMPHRGDYLARHRLDAEVDPIPCIRCHGNPKASRTCVRCHGGFLATER